MRLSLFLLFDEGAGDRGIALDRGLRLCGAADELGFDTVWVAEHHFGRHGRMPNPAVFLAAAAMLTRRVRLGPAVAVLPFRHPVILAEDYALVDRLSGGRLVMGVGSGAIESEFTGFGLSMDERQASFDERIAALQALWAQDTVSMKGAHVSLDEVGLNVRPAQAPGPPIHVATNKVETARQVGRSGLGLLTLVSPTLESLEPVALRLEAHRRGLEEAGHDRGRARSAAVVIMAGVAGTAEEARARTLAHLSRFAEAHGIPAQKEVPLYDVMKQHGTGAFGTPIEAARPIDRLLEMGADEVVLWNCFDDMHADTAINSMRHLIEHFGPPVGGSRPVRKEATE